MLLAEPLTDGVIGLAIEVHRHESGGPVRISVCETFIVWPALGK